ncbi:uncharacterized protein BT62DRAFT_332632 [Guyanagaster necrorhizus]|uniref:Uncharacterized protein n=1 Tax=Guyanagaster necrorhizus TaxID=856835 RepID=A0A9P8AR32_9AGAR|nr:uncharacterized protein BT62DRAFT_332632 [Guyanagaster necrorhizus MCA 3950]KAG7443467.1 hypothetical protein BT62DRAFT_332632 [Guyanagaster necrorhizus MCA 3950]
MASWICCKHDKELRTRFTEPFTSNGPRNVRTRIAATLNIANIVSWSSTLMPTSAWPVGYASVHLSREYRNALSSSPQVSNKCSNEVAAFVARY